MRRGTQRPKRAALRLKGWRSEGAKLGRQVIRQAHPEKWGLRQKAVAALGFNPAKKFSQAQNRAVRRRMQEIVRTENDSSYTEQRRRVGMEKATQRLLSEPEQHRQRPPDDRQKQAIEESYKKAAKQRSWEIRERTLRFATEAEIINSLENSLSYSLPSSLGREMRRIVGDYHDGSYFNWQRAIECLKEDFMNA